MSFCAADDAAVLPGPGYSLPVDVDGDGKSGYADQYAFNYWLGLGGSLALALEEASTDGGVIDLSRFFASPESALGPDAAILLPSPRSDAGRDDACTTTATLTSAFGGTSATTGCVFEDAAKLGDASGLAIAPDGAVYIALRREVGDITIAWLDSKVHGSIPLPDPNWVSLCGVSGLVNPTQVVWVGPTSGASDSVIVTEDAPYDVLSSVKRTLNPPYLWARYVLYSDLALADIAYGLARLGPDAPPTFGAPGDILISEDRNSLPGRMKRFQPGQGGSAIDAYHNDTSYLDRVRGLVLGNFNGQGTYGAYAAEWGRSKVIRFGAIHSGYGGYTKSDFCSNVTQAENLVFDPYSPYLFVSGGSQIWRVSKIGGKQLFAENLSSPKGMALLPGGTMVVAESSARLTVLDGWRYRFNRGDANGDSTVNLPDSQYILNFLFLSGPEPACADTADVNDDGVVDVSDASYLLSYLYSGGAAPPPPFFEPPGGDGQCGYDRTADLLGCRYYPGVLCNAP